VPPGYIANATDANSTLANSTAGNATAPGNATTSPAPAPSTAAQPPALPLINFDDALANSSADLNGTRTTNNTAAKVLEQLITSKAPQGASVVLDTASPQVATSQPPDGSGANKGLAIGSIIGIVIGVIALLSLVALGTFMFFKRKEQRLAQQSAMVARYPVLASVGPARGPTSPNQGRRGLNGGRGGLGAPE
jgi:hypothetical protein